MAPAARRMTVDFSGRARKAAPARSRAAQMTSNVFSLRVRKSAICRAMLARAREASPVSPAPSLPEGFSQSATGRWESRPR